MSNWEYDPVPRYFFFWGELEAGEVIFDGFQRAPCNDFNPQGEVWRAIVDGCFVGRFRSLGEAQEAVRSNVVNRGLKLIVSKTHQQKRGPLA